MGIHVYCDARTLWEPSQVVGRLFVSQVHALEKVYGHRSGIGRVVSDEVEVNADRLADFLEDMLNELARSSNDIEYGMITTCVAISIALFVKATGKSLKVPSKTHALLDSIFEEARTVLEPMDIHLS